MKTLATLLSMLCAILWATTALACQSEAEAKPLISTSPGEVSGVAILEPIPLSQPFGLQLLFCGKDATTIKEIKVGAVMPAHQHGMNYTPVVDALGDGRFAVSGMVFHMPGLWAVQIAATGSAMPMYFTLEVHAR